MTTGSRTGDLRNFAKAAAAPLAVVVVMLLMAWVAHDGLTRVSGRTDQIVQHNLDGSAKVAQIAARVQGINAQLYRLMTLRAAGMDKIGRQDIEQLGGEVDQVIAELSEYRDLYARESQIGAINDALRQLHDYKGAVIWVASMLEIDFRSAVDFLRPFHAVFAQLTALLTTMTDETVSEAHALSAEATMTARQTGLWFVLVAVAVGAGMGLFAWLAGRHHQKLLFTTVHLEQMVAERTAELRQAKEQAEAALDQVQRAQKQLVEAEKMASLGELVAGVAHEINTPVGTTLTAASLLEERTREVRQLYAAGQMKKSDLERFLGLAGESTGVMMRNIERAAELIHSFKQVAADRTSAERRQFTLGQFLDEVLMSLMPRIKRSGATVTADGPSDIAMDSYPGALSQVVTNLVVNALVHAFPADHAGTVRLQFRREGGNMVELRFIDDGAGIPAEMLPRIFDPFFTTRRGAGGTGLGLNIVYNIVTQTLGGTISVESEVGQGTSFVLRLPTSVEVPAEALPA